MRSYAQWRASIKGVPSRMYDHAHSSVHEAHNSLHPGLRAATCMRNMLRHRGILNSHRPSFGHRLESLVAQYGDQTETDSARQELRPAIAALQAPCM